MKDIIPYGANDGAPFYPDVTNTQYEDKFSEVGFQTAVALSQVAGLDVWRQEHTRSSNGLAYVEAQLREEFKKPLPRERVREFRQESGLTYGDDFPTGSWAIGVRRPEPSAPGINADTGILLAFGTESSKTFDRSATVALPVTFHKNPFDDYVYRDPVSVEFEVGEGVVGGNMYRRMLSERASQELLLVAQRFVGLVLEKDPADMPAPLPYTMKKRSFSFRSRQN